MPRDSVEQLKEVICPTCNGPSYFPLDKSAGYCINCGRIVNCDQSNTRAIGAEKPDTSPAKEYRVYITYKRTARQYDQALRAELLGDASRRFYISEGDTVVIKLPEGKYQLAFFSHVSQGVLSTDVVNSVIFDLKSDRRYTVTANRHSFHNGLIIE